MSKDWFQTWFDATYYHILYQNRDEAEARHFIDNLIANMAIQADKRVLDLACGKGRHAIYLADRGMDVVGLDLSPKSIEFASKYEKEHLSFYTHDMREPFRINYFDFILNLFTSFGYFQSIQAHLKVLESVASGLKSEGLFILDFFNVHRVLSNMVPEESLIKEDIIFNIKRFEENNIIIKQIEVLDQSKRHVFEERVHGFDLNAMESMFANTDMEIVSVFGNYNLEEYNESSSERMIIKARKS